MKAKNLLLALAAILCVGGCSNDNYEEKLPEEQFIEDEAPVSRNYAIPIEMSNSQELISNRLHVFSWKLFGQAYKMREDLAEANGHKNVLISPLSLMVDLSMLQNGLKGETLKNLQEILGIEDCSVSEINSFMKVLTNGIKDADDQISFHCANSFWYNNGLLVNPVYENKLIEFYQAKIQQTDFYDQETASLINKWCEENTNGKIKKIIEATSPGQDFHLLNTIHFKGGWAKQFPKEMTAKAPFHNADGSITETEMMNSSISTYYNEKDTYSIARLEFRYGAFNFFMILPKEGYDVNDILTSINPDDMDRAEKAIVDLSLPRLEIEYGSKKIMDCLLGIDNSFSFAPSDTDFFIDHDTNISQIIQKAYLSLYEEGSEVAAVTDITSHIHGDRLKNVTMHLDRPFIYGIVETSTNIPLFIGYYGN